MSDRSELFENLMRELSVSSIVAGWSQSPFASTTAPLRYRFPFLNIDDWDSRSGSSSNKMKCWMPRCWPAGKAEPAGHELGTHASTVLFGSSADKKKARHQEQSDDTNIGDSDAQQERRGGGGSSRVHSTARLLAQRLESFNDRA